MVREFVDSYRHKGLRQQLTNDLAKNRGIRDKRILEAINTIPRHYFLDDAFADWAYKDIAFPIDADQTISQPYTVAFQTELLKVEKGMRVLEIGTGSGYQACVLAFLGAKVYSIERQEKLFKKTEAFLPKIGFNQIRTLLGDGFKGAPRFAPFDRILITCGAKSIPEALLEQLEDGGIMVVPVGSGNSQTMYRVIRQGNKFKKEKHGLFRFVPMLKGIQKK